MNYYVVVRSIKPYFISPQLLAKQPCSAPSLAPLAPLGKRVGKKQLAFNL